MIVARVSQGLPSDMWLLVAVYGDPARSDNPRIWAEIQGYMSAEDLPTCVLGDFNAIAHGSEKRGGNSRLSAPNRAFRDWLRDAGLLDLGHNSPAYTWSNGQGGRANVSQRLDRVVANLNWTTMNPTSAVFDLPCFNSDHLPILLRTKPACVKGKKDFKCENWWLFKDGFKDLCEKVASQGIATWSHFRSVFIKEVKRWVGTNSTPDHLLKEVEGRMLLVNGRSQDGVTIQEAKDLQKEHRECLQMMEYLLAPKIKGKMGCFWRWEYKVFSCNNQGQKQKKHNSNLTGAK